MLKLFLWLRYLRKRKVVEFGIAAVALSVSLLIIVASLFYGFIERLEHTAVQTIGDVVLLAPTKFAKYPQFIEQLESRLGGTVEAATATLSTQGLLHLGKGDVRAVHIWGIDPVSRAKVTGFKQYLRRQSRTESQPSFTVPDRPQDLGGFVGIAVIAEPNEKTDEYDYGTIEQMIGQQVILTSGTVIEAKESSSNAVDSDARLKKKTLQFTIVDIIETGVYDLDESFVYLPIEKVQEILYPDQSGQLANQIQIKLKNNTQPELAVAQIRGLWQVFAADQLGWNERLIRYTDIETAQQLQSKFVAELKKQLGVLLVIFGVVSFSVVVLVFCIFYMIVRLKQKDIAIIKSCGAASSSVALIFLGFGVCVGIVGSCFGAALGYIITKNINDLEKWIRIIFGLKLWKSSVYMFSRIPNEVDWASAFTIILLAIIAAGIGTLIPAVVAARTKPVEILRYE